MCHHQDRNFATAEFFGVIWEADPFSQTRCIMFFFFFFFFMQLVHFEAIGSGVILHLSVPLHQLRACEKTPKTRRRNESANGLAWCWWSLVRGRIVTLRWEAQTQRTTVCSHWNWWSRLLLVRLKLPRELETWPWWRHVGSLQAMLSIRLKPPAGIWESRSTLHYFIPPLIHALYNHN